MQIIRTPAKPEDNHYFKDLQPGDTFYIFGNSLLFIKLCAEIRTTVTTPCVDASGNNDHTEEEGFINAVRVSDWRLVCLEDLVHVVPLDATLTYQAPK